MYINKLFFINDIHNFPSINSDYMISEQGFEFDLEKEIFLREFLEKQIRGEESWGVSLKHRLQGHMG